MTTPASKLDILRALDQKVLWLSSWMIHNANHIRPNSDGIKVGGHQASSASSATILSALYLDVLRSEDRVAVKPHASPAFHALSYLLGRQSLDKMKNFRGYKGAQSYPSRTKDQDDVDFSTGSVGLGVAQSLFASLVQDYVAARGWLGDRREGRMISIVGDAELDEGNIHEALIEGWKQGLRNTWWIIDYNRQSLDAIVHEDLWQKFESMFRNYGWDVVIIKYGRKLEAAFAEAGGQRLKAWIDACPNQLYAALCFQGGGAFRKRLDEDFADNADARALIARRSDDELITLMSNLGGHDLESLLAAFHAVDHDRPTCFLAYTIKGIGLPFQGHKDNHSGLMTVAQMDALRTRHNVRPGHEWEPFEGLSIPEAELQGFLANVPFAASKPRRLNGPTLPTPDTLEHPKLSSMSTQQGFGLILNALARSEHPIAERIVTTSPDVTVSTNLGSWVNRRGLFARKELVDLFRQERIPSSFTWDFSTKGQHFELGIAEMNLFILLAALGLSHTINGQRLLPIGTVYDPFVERGLDALNYACYQDARFMIVGTPAGITLAPEGGAHQSIKTPLIGMSQAGLATFEPAFVDELAAIMAWGFAYMQRDGTSGAAASTDADDGHGGSVYLRLTTRTIAQRARDMTAELRADIVNGGYWLDAPPDTPDVVIAYCGAMAPEAIAAAATLNARGIRASLLAITSPARLYSGWSTARKAAVRGESATGSHIERLLEGVDHRCRIVTVLDGHPATLAWIGSVNGHATTALGVEEFGETGTIDDLYRRHGIDADAIVRASTDRRTIGAQPAKTQKARRA
ncbi:MAG: transketolase-like TK C-terminal-containing protein [Hyphomicrobium sp.]